MKILMLHPHDIRHQPWTIRMVKLAEELAKKGHKVRVGFVEDKRAQEPDYKRIREIPEGPVEYFALRSRDKQTHKNILTVVRRAKDVDLIHFQKCFASTFVPALWAAWRWNKPLHYDWDDHETLILREIRGLPPGFLAQARFFEARIPSYVDTISVSSDELLKECLSLGFPESRIRKVPVGADPDDFGNGKAGEAFRKTPPLMIGDRPLVTYLGQIEGANYAPLFLEAIRTLVDDFPEVVWLVVGGGRGLLSLEERAFQLDLSSRVVFTDYMETTRIPAVLAATDIAVACFSNDRFVRCKSPLKVAEYMAAGKAIVASNVGEVPWMTGNTAILVQPGDAEDLARGIRFLLENPDHRNELGRKARERAETMLTWRAAADRLEEAYLVAVKFHSERNDRALPSPGRGVG